MKFFYGGPEVGSVDNGIYLARVVGFENKMSKGGNEMVELTLEIGETMVKDYFTEKTPKFKMNGLASSIGLDINTKTPQELPFNCAYMLDKVLEVKVVNEDRNGKMYPKIDSYLPMGTIPSSE